MKQNLSRYLVSKIAKAGLSLGLAAGLTLSATSSVYAQSVDYSSYEELFGEPVTSSATGTPKRASEAPVTMIIITGEDIRRSPVTNIAALLRNYAGMEVSQQGADSYDVGVRGGNSPFYPLLLVMVNGRQVYADHFGYVVWNAIPVELEEIQQIEVVKGPNGAIFGFNAAVGVVNIITKNPLYDQGGDVSAEYGFDSMLRLSGNFRTKLTEKLGFRLSAGYDEQEPFNGSGSFDTSAGGSIPYINEAFVRRNGKQPVASNAAVEFMYQVSDTVQFMAEGTFSESFNYNNATSRFPFTVGAETYSVRGKVIADTDYGLIEASVYHNWFEQTSDFGFNRSLENTLNNNVLVAQLQNSYQINPKNLVRASLEYRDNTFIGNPSFAGEVGFDLFAGGMLWEHKLTDKLTTTVAGRIDHVRLGQRGDIDPNLPFVASDFERNITDYTLNGSVTYAVSANDSLRAIFGRGLQLPSLMVFGVGTAAPFGIFAGDPSLDPTVVYNYELAYDRKVAAIDGILRTSIFYREVNGFNLFPSGPTIVPPAVPVAIGQSQLIGDFESQGFEIILNGKTGNFNWGVDYTYTDVDEFIPLNAGISTFYAVPFAPQDQTPTHKVNISLGYSANGLTIDVFGRYRSTTGELGGVTAEGFPRYAFDSHVVFDARVAYKLDSGVEVFFAGENLTDTVEANLTAVGSEPRVRAGVRFSF